MASNKLKEAIELLYNNPMTIDEITNALDVSRQTLHSWMKTGRFTETRRGKYKAYYTDSLELAGLESISPKVYKIRSSKLPEDLYKIGQPPVEEVATAYTKTMQGEINFNFSNMLREVDTPAKAASLKKNTVAALHLALYAEKLMKEGTLSE